MEELKRLFGYNSHDKLMDFIEKAKKEGDNKADVVVQYGTFYLHEKVPMYKIGVYLESNHKISLTLNEYTIQMKESERERTGAVKKAGDIKVMMKGMGFDSEIINRRYKGM
jgi:hypothetical protein